MDSAIARSSPLVTCAAEHCVWASDSATARSIEFGGCGEEGGAEGFHVEGTCLATILILSLMVGRIGLAEPDGGVGMGPMGGDSGHDSFDALALARMAARASSDMVAVANSVSARAARARRSG